MTFRISVFEVFFSLVLGSSSGFSTAHASSQQIPLDKSWVKSLETAELQFPAPDSEWAAATPGRHPAPVHWFLNRILKWDPQDQDPSPRGDCALPQFVNQLSNATSPKEKTQIYKQYHNNCEDQYVTGSLLAQWQAFRLFSMSYNIDEHPFLNRVVLHLPDGKKLKGMLAIKDGKKRPLVILRMGITGNVEEAFAERFFYYQLFERSLFNFLMVENMTSSDFIHNNKTLEFAGIAESYQNFWIARTLRDPKQPISKLIESLHLVGLSLGGQGVLTAAWLAPFQKNPEIFQSFLALCPLVNLRPTFNFLFKEGIAGLPLELWAHSRFTEVKDFRPELFQEFFGLPHRVLKTVSENYKKPDAKIFGVVEPEFIAKENDFFNLHQLSTWDPAIRRPVWVWVTEKDAIVPYEINTYTLKDVYPVVINVGNHCSFPAAWDGRMTQAMFRGHILGATKFSPDAKSVQLDVSINENWDLNNVKPKGDSGRLEVTLISEKREKVTFEVNITDLDFQFRSKTLSEPEKRMIRRWLSTNLTFTPGPDGRGMTVSWPFVKN